MKKKGRCLRKLVFSVVILLGTIKPFVDAISAEPANLVQTLIKAENIRSHRLQRAQGRTNYYSFISSGLPKECQVGGGNLQNEASVNIISDAGLSSPLRIQVVGLYPTPLANSCMMTLATALTKLPPDTHSVSNNLTALDRGGQLVLDFSIPRPLPSWILDIIPVEIGGRGSLPSKIEGWKLTVICLMFMLIGLRLIFGGSFKKLNGGKYND
ncbi:MAG: hypothetical protein ABIQ95_00380 [Bdellovibrionia bacterium]